MIGRLSGWVQQAWRDPWVRLPFVLCVVSGSIAAYRVNSRIRSHGPLFDVGTDISTVETMDASGQIRSLATGEWTLLLVFKSDCRWCSEIAPQWAKWITDHPDTPALALSSEPYSTGRWYAAEKGWDIEVRQVLNAGRLGGKAQALVSRTPFVFVVGPDGVIEAVGYGSGLDSLHAFAGRKRQPITF